MLSGPAAQALMRGVQFEIGGKPYYGLVMNQQRVDPSYPGAEPSELNSEDFAFGALERLIYSGKGFFALEENLRLLAQHPKFNMAEERALLRAATDQGNLPEVNRIVERVIKRLVEQWMIEQYKKTRPYINAEFFDQLRDREPIDKPGTTTLAVFDEEKRLIATLGVVIRTPEHPLLDLETTTGVRLPPFQIHWADYKIMRMNSIQSFARPIAVGRDAELKKFIVDPARERTIIPALLYVMETFGFMSYGQSTSPEYLGWTGIGSEALAIGRYYLECDKNGMILYRRHYKLDVHHFDEASGTYIMSATRDQLLDVWKSFVPREELKDGAPGALGRLLTPMNLKNKFQYPSYAISKLELSREKRGEALREFDQVIGHAACALKALGH